MKQTKESYLQSRREHRDWEEQQEMFKNMSRAELFAGSTVSGVRREDDGSSGFRRTTTIRLPVELFAIVEALSQIRNDSRNETIRACLVIGFEEVEKYLSTQAHAQLDEIVDSYLFDCYDQEAAE